MKKTIKVTLIALSTLLLVSGCGCKKQDTNAEKTPEEEVKVNTNEGVIKDQTLDVFTFENTSMVCVDGTTKLETLVTNTSDTKQELAEFKISVKDKEGNEMETLAGFFGGSIEAKESKTITSYSGQDLTSSTSIEYSIVK